MHAADLDIIIRCIMRLRQVCINLKIHLLRSLNFSFLLLFPEMIISRFLSQLTSHVETSRYIVNRFLLSFKKFVSGFCHAFDHISIPLACLVEHQYHRMIFDYLPFASTFNKKSFLFHSEIVFPITCYVHKRCNQHCYLSSSAHKYLFKL